MTMKKIILASVVAVGAVSSMHANANATICGAATAATSGQAVATGSFVKTAFTPKCSANVYLSVNDQTTYLGVGAASSKGKNIFTGSTAAGGVTASGSCATSGCTSTNADSAATSAPAS